MDLKNIIKSSRGKKSRKVYRLDLLNKMTLFIACVSIASIAVVVPTFLVIATDEDGLQFSKDGLKAVTTTRVYDGNGEMIYEGGEEIREDVTYDQIPQCMIDAFLAIEDSRFFEHNGFDLPRFLSAGLTNLARGDLGQGGSTLTMQMIDNSFTMSKQRQIESEKGYVPTVDKLKLKVQEMYLAMVSEGQLTKEEIFEYYVNRIWFGSGNNTRGLQKATQYFFGKDVTELNVGEAAFLAGAVNSPGAYNPINNKYYDDADYLQAATNRRNVTLELMYNHGYLTREEYELAVNTRLEFALKSTKYVSNDPNEAYLDQVLAEAEELSGLDPLVEPMEIYTCLNQDLQREADNICLNKNSEVVYPNGIFDIGFSIIDNSNGEILAVGAGRRYHEMEIKIDNSTDRKQPGSSMKPILAYAPCFDLLGWATTHTVMDVAKDYWQSGTNLNNSDGVYRGAMSLQDALGVSKNTTAAQAMIDLIGVTTNEYWADYCKMLGYDDDVYEGFNVQYSIGGSNMWASPIQQASAYSMLGNGGTRVESHRIRQIKLRRTGETIEGDKTEYDLISPQAAFMMSTLLEKVVSGNYGNFNEVLVNSNYPVYGKSGTSDWGDAGLAYGIPLSTIRDEWSLGYTNRFTVATWTGYTSEYFTQGYYPTLSDLMNYKTAFHCTKYMLAVAEKYSDGYGAIARPDGISDYAGGYILTKFLKRGDSTVNLKSDEDKEKEELEKKKKACEEQNGDWDDEVQKCFEKVEEKSPNQTACEVSNGIWYNDACACPTGTQLNGNGICEAVTQEPEPEPEPEPADKEPTQGNPGTVPNSPIITPVEPTQPDQPEDETHE